MVRDKGRGFVIGGLHWKMNLCFMKLRANLYSNINM